MENWKGKIAVVTGASAGIGEAIAKSLVKKGMIVVGLARSEDKLKKIATQCNGKFHGIKCDVSDASSIESAFRNIEKQFGGVDLMINNAATMNFSAVSDGDPLKWKQIFDTNVMGLSMCNKEALKTMRTRGDDGHIINVNSIAGKKVIPLPREALGMYSSSKFALTALSETLRIELRTKKSLIKVTNLCPGLVYTDMGVEGANYYLNTNMTRNEQGPPPGYMAAEDIADVVINILSMNPRVEIQEVSLQSNTMNF